jgi:ribosomal protein S18 acetylase RimI-like enzyme
MKESINFHHHIENEPEVLRTFLYHAIYVPPGSPEPNPKILNLPDISRYVDHWGRSGDLSVFALDKGKVIGVCWSRIFPPSTPGYGTIDSRTPELSIALLSEYRGQGIGSTLLNLILSDLKTRARAVSLSVAEDNPALRLYQRFGFTVHSKHGKSLIMVKWFKYPIK